jgi:NADH:ubiquinone oxidoreductase subunit E
MPASGDLHYVFICQGKNCLDKGSRELLNHIRAALGDQETFRVIPFICFGACTAAPNIAVFPDRLWYSTVTAEHFDDLVQCIRCCEEIPELSGKVGADLKNLVFRLLEKPLRV